MSYEDCIDVVQEWVQAQGYLTTGYVHVPSHAGWHFSEADFIEDGTWREIDLSAIIPVGTKAVHFVGRFKNWVIGKGAHFGTAGEVPLGPYHSEYIVVANTNHGAVYVITPSADRKIAYLFSAGGWITNRINILGWWI